MYIIQYRYLAIHADPVHGKGNIHAVVALCSKGYKATLFLTLVRSAANRLMVQDFCVCDFKGAFA